MSIFTTASLLDSCGCCTGRIWHARRAFLLAAAGAAALPVAAQVDVGKSSAMRQLVPAEQLETSATQQYDQMLAQAKAKRALAPDNHPAMHRRPNRCPWSRQALIHLHNNWCGSPSDKCNRKPAR